MNTKEGLKTVKDLDLRNKTCKACVRTAVTIIEDMIKDMPNQSAGDK